MVKAVVGANWETKEKARSQILLQIMPMLLFAFREALTQATL